MFKRAPWGPGGGGREGGRHRSRERRERRTANVFGKLGHRGRGGGVLGEMIGGQKRKKEKGGSRQANRGREEKDAKGVGEKMEKQ